MTGMPPAIDVMFDAPTIRRRVGELADEIVAALPRAALSEGLLAVGVLKGGAIFLADLVRALGTRGVPLQIDFLRLASYGAGTVSSGEVTLVHDLTMDLRGRHVLLVDDIADTGRTLAFARARLLDGGPAGVRTVVFLDKPSRREVEVPVEHRGFIVPDCFVIGYGTDRAEDFRELDYIGVLAR